MRSPQAFLILAACGISSFAEPVYADPPVVHYRVMALTGTDGNLGPQLGANVVFDSFEHRSGPVININGTVAFGAYLDGPGIGSSNDRGLFFADQTGVTLIAQQSSTLTTLRPVFNPTPLSLSDLDATAATAVQTTECHGRRVAIREFSRTGMVTLAKGFVLGALGTGVPGSTFDFGARSYKAISASGDVLFDAHITGRSIDGQCTQTVHHEEDTRGIWVLPAGGNPMPVALSRTHLPEFPDHLGPGLEPGVYFQYQSTWQNSINDHREFTFPAALGGVPAASRGTIYRGTLNGIELVARTGTDGAYGPGLGTGVHFIAGWGGLINETGSVRINNQGRIAFGGSTNQGRGIFVSDPGQPVRPIVLTGTDGVLGPQLGPNRIFVWSGSIDAAVDGAGRVFSRLQVQLGGSSYPYVFTVHEGGVNRVLIMQGNTAQYGPGMGSSIAFAILHPWFTVNKSGQMVFAADLTGVPTNQRDGIWHSDLDHGLTLIAQAGTQFEVAPGDARVIAEPRMVNMESIAAASGGQDGRPRALNDAGEMVMLLKFTDGSQAIVVAKVEYPGPACYANCDGSTSEPILTVDDFTCFINEFAGAQSLPHEAQITHYANCDGSTTAPVLTVDDFTCFINEFAQGCT